MDRLLHELRHALRRLRRSPGFAAAALATLALGIGANTLIFSVVNAIFLRPLSYRDPAKLVWITEFFPKYNRSMVLTPDYAAWKQHSESFEQLEGMGGSFGTNVAKPGTSAAAERIETAHITPGFFAMIGIRPRLGAGFDFSEQDAARPVAIVSDALWRGFLQADPAILGKSLTINAKPYSIVGVMPPGFIYPDGDHVGVWLPDAVLPISTSPAHRPAGSVRLIGRLKPDVSIDRARADLDRIARGMDQQYPAPLGSYHSAATVKVFSLQKQLTVNSETATGVLMGAVGFLLLIACANVDNLFLARAVARRKEIAMRTAIGASRRDIVRMLLTESVLLGVLGGALGIAFLFWGRSAVLFLSPKTLAQGIPIDWRVLAFTAACSLAAGVLFGLAPSLLASRVDVNSGLKGTPSGSAGLLPAFLAAGQIALSVVLLAGAGLMIRSFLLLASSDPGFDARNVLTATVMLRPDEVYGPPKQIDFNNRLLAGVQNLPGVRYAAVASSPPMTQFSELEGGFHDEDGRKIDDIVSIASVSGDYFQTLGIRLVSGRFFDARDRPEGTRVAIINQSLARLLFPGRNPIGRQFSQATVVGVVADIRHRTLDDKVWPELFLPFDQYPSIWLTVLVRGVDDPSALAAPIRRIAQSIDSSQPVFDVDLLEHRVSESLTERRERASVLTAFAALALLIAVVGIYSVMSYSVARRTYEIGVRMALGAARGQVLRMIVHAGLRIATVGIIIGLTGALFVTRVLKTFLYGVEPTDAITFVLVCATLTLAAFLASYFPARRAARVDPMVALRQE